jgi:hypothetical protein
MVFGPISLPRVSYLNGRVSTQLSPVGVAESAVVIDRQGNELLVALQQKLDRRFAVFSGNDGLAQVGNAESFTINA